MNRVRLQPARVPRPSGRTEPLHPKERTLVAPVPGSVAKKSAFALAERSTLITSTRPLSAAV